MGSKHPLHKQAFGSHGQESDTDWSETLVNDSKFGPHEDQDLDGEGFNEKLETIATWKI